MVPSNILLAFRLPTPGAGTPIAPVIPLVAHSLVNLAPERSDDVLKEISNKSLVLTNDPFFNAWASSERGEIGLTMNLVECLWCAAYAYWVFEREVESQVAAGSSPIVLTPVPGNRVQRGMSALTAAVDAASTGTPLVWTGLPVPQVGFPPGTDEQAATEMALAAIGFVLHHELSHLRLGHQTRAQDESSWTLDKEKDADSEAIEWILGSTPDDERNLAKRTWGVAIVTLFMTAYRLRKKKQMNQAPAVEAHTHPLPYDRLGKALGHHAVTSRPRVKEAMARIGCAATIPNLQMEGIQLPLKEYQDFAHLQEACFDEYARLLVE